MQLVAQLVRTRKRTRLIKNNSFKYISISLLDRSNLCSSSSSVHLFIRVREIFTSSKTKVKNTTNHSFGTMPTAPLQMLIINYHRSFPAVIRFQMFFFFSFCNIFENSTIQKMFHLTIGLAHVLIQRIIENLSFSNNSSEWAIKSKSINLNIFLLYCCYFIII